MLYSTSTSLSIVYLDYNMPRRVSKGSIKSSRPLISLAAGSTSVHARTHPQQKNKKENKTRDELFEEQTERRIEAIRRTPVIDRFGRAHSAGTPLGIGDKQWRRQHGIGAKYSPKPPFLGIGISRDSFLPSECKLNEKRAMRTTPRSSKLPQEVRRWATRAKGSGWQQHDKAFDSALRLVAKRVAGIDSLFEFGITPEQAQELRPLIYKFASYSLLDRRPPNAHFGHATREQMLKSQLWQGDITTSASDVFYFPSYKLVDPTPISPMLGGGPDPGEWRRKRAAEAAREAEAAAPREAHWSEHTEMPRTFGVANFDARVRTAPKFSFGTSQRPPINGAQSTVNPPIGNVPFTGDPRFLPRYKTFGAKYQSFGPKEPTKSLRPKTDEWGAPLKPRPAKMKNPARFGVILAPKNSCPYSVYKMYG